jgi:hypothetical protein
LLVVQAACTDQVLYQKLRAGSLARMQDNQLFTALSFLVGDNQLSRAQRTPFTGKSAIFAPQELSPRSNGVLVEMGNLSSEGVLAAQWDFAALRDLWETSETPVRRQLPLQQAGQVLAQIYARLQTLPKVAELDQLPGVTTAEAMSRQREAVSLQSLDDLVVIATVTQRWPPQLEAPIEGAAALASLKEKGNILFPEPADRIAGRANHGIAPEGVQSAHEIGHKESRVVGENDKTGEDETDEMDPVAGSEMEQ